MHHPYFRRFFNIFFYTILGRTNYHKIWRRLWLTSFSIPIASIISIVKRCKGTLLKIHFPIETLKVIVIIWLLPSRKQNSQDIFWPNKMKGSQEEKKSKNNIAMIFWNIDLNKNIVNELFSQIDRVKCDQKYFDCLQNISNIFIELSTKDYYFSTIWL